MNSDSTRVTFIVPAFNEEENIAPFYQAFASVFNASGLAWDLIFIDDGSTDGTRENLKSLAASSPHVLAISFSRNFGKEAAIWAGLNNAEGDVVGIIDADLQQRPEDALNMVRLLLDNDDCDMVAAYQGRRHESACMTAVKDAFYTALDALMDVPVIKNASDFRVFRTCVAKTILNMPEYHRFSKGIFAWVGYRTLPYEYEPDDRQHGESKWSFFKLIQYALSGIISFSIKPLRAASWLGMALAVLAFLYFIVVMVQKLVFGIPIEGYATLVCLILLLGGVQLLFLGIAGEYIGRTYIQGKNRPIYIEARRYASDDMTGAPQGVNERTS